jgi:ribosomal-protein-alanine N-acetyltransferase
MGRGAAGGALATGERVLLRWPRPGDRSAFHALREASREHLAPWEPEAVEPDPGSRRRFRSFLRTRRTPDRRRTLVVRRADDALLGAISLSNITRGVFQNATLGYWIGAPHARQGYMREALDLMVGLAFDGLGLHRLEANLRPENEASRALARGAGFRLEGLSPQFLRIAGAWRDHERWALLEPEWRARQGGATSPSAT